MERTRPETAAAQASEHVESVRSVPTESQPARNTYSVDECEKIYREIAAQQAYKDAIITRNQPLPSWAIDHPQEDLRTAKIPESMIYEDNLKLGYDRSTIDEVLRKRKGPDVIELTSILQTHSTLLPADSVRSGVLRLYEMEIAEALREIIPDAKATYVRNHHRKNKLRKNTLQFVGEEKRWTEVKKKLFREERTQRNSETELGRIDVNVSEMYKQISISITPLDMRFLPACSDTLERIRQDLLPRIPGYQAFVRVEPPRYPVDIDPLFRG